MSTNSTGMATLENFSMPFFTPPRTMAATSTMKAVWAKSGCQVEEMNFPKKPDTSSAGMSVKSKESDLNRYSTLQPPTTE